MLCGECSEMGSSGDPGLVYEWGGPLPPVVSKHLLIVVGQMALSACQGIIPSMAQNPSLTMAVLMLCPPSDFWAVTRFPIRMTSGNKHSIIRNNLAYVSITGGCLSQSARVVNGLSSISTQCPSTGGREPLAFRADEKMSATKVSIVVHTLRDGHGPGVSRNFIWK